MRKIFLLVAFIVLTGSALQAQTGKIFGIIQDDQQKLLQAASVSLLREADSSLVKVAVTDREGRYDFINLKEGKYLLLVTSVGFQKKYSSPFSL